MNRKGQALVVAQFVLIVLVIAGGPWLPRGVVGRMLVGIGGVAGIWAILAMRQSRLRVFPDVAEGAHLVEAGPYRWIRHPMYSSGLLIMLGFVIDQPSPLRIIAWLGLAVVLLAKMRLEEQYLRAAFPDYAAYEARTWRLIPGVF